VAVIKYLGSKRRLVPVLTAIADAVGARRALDCFTGTTRVAQAFKGLGARVTAVDRARAPHVLAQCYVATDARAIDAAALQAELDRLNALPGEDGYVTATFCEQARYFQPANGRRIDAIRAAIAHDHTGSPLEPVLLAALLEAADRVDSTVGVQMAYLKSWAPRASTPLSLRAPALLPGRGRAVRGDVEGLARRLGSFDLAYIDPPYNQHRYEANYHVWETIVAGDEPDHYGVACKRVDLRDQGATSAFNLRRAMPDALAQVVRDVQADVVVLSYNDEAWLSLDELTEMCARRGAVEVLAFESARYVGARIGIHNPRGERVGRVGRVRNVEYVLVAGDRAIVRRAAAVTRAS
jgi:adenine-specific DNA-methyltransferase